MEPEAVTSTATSLISASNVLYVINDLDPESSSPGNILLKHHLGLMNIQDMHLLATANLIAQTQETIAQQYNISVDKKPKKSSPSSSRSEETKVKRISSDPESTAKPPKRSCSSDKRNGAKTDKFSKSESNKELEPPAAYFCTHCKEKFDTDADLKTHHKVHSTLECNQPGCNRKFTWPAHFKYHQLTHGGDKKFSCREEGCGRLFYTDQRLEVHKRTHTNTRPFSCQTCEKSFSTAGNLKNHMRCHTGEKPFACDYPDCDKRFAELSTLKKHKVTHTGQKPFRCDICGKTFTQSSSRKTHIKTHHGGEQTKGDNTVLDDREPINIPNNMIETNTNDTNGAEICTSENEGENTKEVHLVSEEAVEAHIRENLTSTNSPISIIVLSSEEGVEETKINHITVAPTNDTREEEKREPELVLGDEKG